MLLHIAVAVLAIGLFRTKLEHLAGSAHVLGVYLLAGLAGSLAIILTSTMTGLDERSVGASAAFLGLVGAIAASPRGAWGATLVMDEIVIVVLVVQLAPIAGLGDRASSAAHLLGLAVGTAYGLLLRSTTSNEQPELRTPDR